MPLEPVAGDRVKISDYRFNSNSYRFESKYRIGNFHFDNRIGKNSFNINDSPSYRKQAQLFFSCLSRVGFLPGETFLPGQRIFPLSSRRNGRMGSMIRIKKTMGYE